MKTQKLFVPALVLILALSLAACGNGGTAPSDEISTDPPVATEACDPYML